MSLKIWLAVVSSLLAVSLLLNVILLIAGLSAASSPVLCAVPVVEKHPVAELKVLGQTKPVIQSQPAEVVQSQQVIPAQPVIQPQTAAPVHPVVVKKEEQAPVKIDMPVYITPQGRIPLNDAVEILKKAINIKMPQDNPRMARELLDIKIKVMDSFLDTYKDLSKDPAYIKIANIHKTSKVLREVYGN